MAKTETAANRENDGFLSKFTVLKTAPRELWLIYYSKIMEIAAYGLVSLGLMLYLIHDLHFEDFYAGTVISLWSVLISFFTFLAGSLTDALGIRRTFLYGFGICLVTRLFCAFVNQDLVGDAVMYLVPAAALIPMAVGLALMVPVMTAAIRRYTNQDQRSMGFSLFYVMMNVGFIVAGKLFDVIRTSMGKGGVFALLGLELSVYQTVFLVSVGFTLAGFLPVLLFLRPGVEMDEKQHTFTIDPSREKAEQGGIIVSFIQVLKKTGRILAEVMKERDFYRFLLLVTLIVGVRMVFYHMHYTLPPYLDRELGYGSRFGAAWGVLNPAIIVVLVLLVGALAQKVSSYKMIVIGTFLSALPTLLLVLPIDTFEALKDTWLGDAFKWFLAIDGDLSPLYFNLIFFVIIFSVGEAIWSPRLYEYTASVAPKHREGTYMGLSILPYFLAKFGVGPMSGFLLEHYCPAEGARRPEFIWWTVAVFALVTPVSLLLLKAVIKPKGRHEEGTTPQEPEPPKSDRDLQSDIPDEKEE